MGAAFLIRRAFIRTDEEDPLIGYFDLHSRFLLEEGWYQKKEQGAVIPL
jgi:hypothetical protein